jgi:hypothetical protein
LENIGILFAHASAWFVARFFSECWPILIPHARNDELHPDSFAAKGGLVPAGPLINRDALH